MDGRCLLSGIDLESLAADRGLNVVYALLTEEVNGLVDRGEVRLNIRETFLPAVVSEARARLDEVLLGKGQRDRWGETPEAVAGQDAFMNLGNA